MSSIKEIENLKKTILEEYERMDPDDTFKFACHPGVSCFNQCCSDVNIFLTPYDILRLKNRLGISSEEFLAKYTITPIDKNQLYPVVMLKLNDEKGKSCFFVKDEGCSVYEDRPWACRMYPVGVASPKIEDERVDKEFYFLMQEAVCKGFNEGKAWTIREWMENQGVPKYDEFGDLFKELTLHDHFKSGKTLNPQKMEMFHMVCYNIDKFKVFLYGSTFFDRFAIEDDLIEKMKTDDEELLRFGFRWLQFALFGDATIKIKKEATKKVYNAKE
jgi:Fe-S-cluster containining protein